MNEPRSTTERPVLEIQGPYVGNAGDALMLQGIADRLGGAYTLVAKPGLAADAQRIGIDVQPIHRFVRSEVADQFLHALVPEAVQQKRGWIPRSRLAGILDCSGYAYGEPWGRGRMRKMARRTSRRLRRREKLIFLPQMFGTIEDEQQREHVRRTIESADLVFARDWVSTETLLALGVSDANLRRSPDFTNLVSGELPSEHRPASGGVAIVPNHRMLDRPSAAVRDAYVPFLRRAVKGLEARGLEPFLLIHATEDADLAEPLQAELGLTRPAVAGEHPKVLKGILGACHAVIGSRYHALIGAMCQDVPTLGTSWTHKYEVLFEEYGCPECLLSPADPDERLEAALDAITTYAERRSLADRLARANVQRRAQSETMWGEVEAELRRPVAPGN